MDQDNNIGSLIPKPPSSLETAQPGAKRIIAVMVADILALAPAEDAEALFRKACAYRDGDGVPQDHAEAFRWFCRAAERGHADAQFELGSCYFKGHGVPRDSAQAAHWYRKAAEQGLTQAQCKLGVMHSNGEGVPKKNVAAYKWYNLAAAQGDEPAAKNRRLIEQKMTPQQIAEAQRLSAQFAHRKARHPD